MEPKKEYNSHHGKPKSNEPIESVRERRNNYVISFFKQLGMSVRLIGDKNAPNIVYKDSEALNAYVHNFELRFTNKYDKGEQVYMVKLTEKPVYEADRIMDWMASYPRKKVFKIALASTANGKLYLSGYNKEKTEDKYPLFNANNPKIYFTREKALEIVKELRYDGYETVVE